MSFKPSHICMHYLGICTMCIYMVRYFYVLHCIIVVKYIVNISIYYLDIKARQNENGSLQCRPSNIKELHVTFA